MRERDPEHDASAAPLLSDIIYYSRVLARQKRSYVSWESVGIPPSNWVL